MHQISASGQSRNVNEEDKKDGVVKHEVIDNLGKNNYQQIKIKAPITGAFYNERYQRGGMTYHCRRNRDNSNCKGRRSLKRVSKDTT